MDSRECLIELNKLREQTNAVKISEDTILVIHANAAPIRYYCDTVTVIDDDGKKTEEWMIKSVREDEAEEE